jgi:hyperosmotically inducible periplasmic protein
MNIQKFLRATAFASALALSAVAIRAADSGSAIDDATVTAKVKAELVKNPDTKARQIHVMTKNGMVELTGFVDSLAEKQAAERQAQAVEGVKSVDNRLQLAGERTAKSVLSDSSVTAKVKSKLIEDPTTKARDIHVETKAGIVQLSGFVSSSDEKAQAAKIAREVEGVQSVRNDLMVKSDTQ